MSENTQGPPKNSIKRPIKKPLVAEAMTALRLAQVARHGTDMARTWPRTWPQNMGMGDDRKNRPGPRTDSPYDAGSILS